MSTVATVLLGRRVYLRLLSASDAENIVRWRSDAAVASQLFSERPPTIAEHEAWFVSLEQGGDRREFVIVLKDSDRPIGTIGLSNIDTERGQAEYGILIGESDCRYKGMAREASELILKYAFEELDLKRVGLNLFADNATARHLYEKLGFRVDPELATVRVKDGRRRPTLGMWLSREQWTSIGSNNALR